jgi:superfamily I DNA/RNA helicase
MALRASSVRYHLIGGQSFFDRREIRDLLAYLKTFLNPHDDISLLRIANTPARGLSDVTMERLLATSHERKESVFASMKNPMVTTTFQTRTREAIETFVELIERNQSELNHRSHHVWLPDAPAPIPTEAELAAPLRHQKPNTLSAWTDSFLNETGYIADVRNIF